ncbi:MAG: hypothetical protein A2W28_01435 [Gammaproteobacteria bacterium RBG_16_51_14]|nr:MAG: hypothetical protein A2W28_01435 [Gammaproteobacteria bacterium RBG_16_51_14]
MPCGHPGRPEGRSNLLPANLSNLGMRGSKPRALPLGYTPNKTTCLANLILALPAGITPHLPVLRPVCPAGGSNLLPTTPLSGGKS